ncbi:uncharacterized protein LOC133712214 [Rosa rugosa]|uniref:uncharacterized protein LOC133712214 n=1 Tax=Rosa rugosa TaxID=74645 RepID=UPI002B4030DA|nr:uncharacterized protein LOC133712214 [Rosa rugosa]
MAITAFLFWYYVYLMPVTMDIRIFKHYLQKKNFDNTPYVTAPLFISTPILRFHTHGRCNWRLYPNSRDDSVFATGEEYLLHHQGLCLWCHIGHQIYPHASGLFRLLDLTVPERKPIGEITLHRHRNFDGGFHISIATSYFKKAQNQINGEHEGHIHVHTHATHGSLDTNSAESQLLGHRVISKVLELGIVVHSVNIGISLGASEGAETIRPLLVALTFHQVFEGRAMGLGGCIAQAISPPITDGLYSLWPSLVPSQYQHLA